MPQVSVIVPCYNEEKTIHLLLEALSGQSFPLHEMEVLIADGMSTDRTRMIIADYMRTHPELSVRIVDNPKRVIPSALNTAIQAARGEILIRLDAHSVPQREYIERCVDDLERGLGENVGGVWRIMPGGEGAMAKAIALASAHPLGVGDAVYRYAVEAAEVDTVPFGAFRKELINRIGGYNENLLTNEDYELNARIRMNGGKIWLDPTIVSCYFARSNLASLAKQYWRYGYWKLRMLINYPATLRWRQALPPLFVLSLFFCLGLLPFWWVAGLLLGLELIGYTTVLVAASIPLARKYHQVKLVLLIPAAIAVMHLSWGSGFLWSLVSKPFQK